MTSSPRIKIICFYDVGSGYELEVKTLQQSLKRFCLDHRVYEYPKFQSWQEAVSFKPEFILRALNDHPSYDGVLYVDADAQFARRPDFRVLDGFHLAVHYFKRSPQAQIETLTGTVFVANTPTTKSFLKEWISLTGKFKHSSTPEQDSLKILLRRKAEGFYVGNLSPEWCWIFDTSQDIYGKDLKPVIVHYQASRRLRKPLKPKKRKPKKETSEGLPEKT